MYPNPTQSTPLDTLASDANSQPRKRISRACDACNLLRTKCNGGQPCGRCKDSKLKCTYLRELKKRGKVSRKDNPQQPGPPPSSSTSRTPLTDLHRKRGRDTADASSSASNSPRHWTNNQESSQANTTPLYAHHPTSHPGHAVPSPGVTYDPHLHHQSLARPQSNPCLIHEPQPYSNLAHSFDHQDTRPHVTTYPSLHQAHQSPYNLPSPSSQNGAPYATAINLMAGSPLDGNAHSQSPPSDQTGRRELPSPLGVSNMANPFHSGTQWLRYPVLLPILPRITAIIPVSLACDLLDVYFSTLTTASAQPASPLILAFPVRKARVLHVSDPRPCTKALLASMLWVGAHTSESPFLTSPPSRRAKICNHLLELSISLLNPLVHVPFRSTSIDRPSNDYTLNEFVGAHLNARPDEAGGPIGGHVTLDDVLTYINIATVVSASEYKAASLRWWTAAFTIARELKLGREYPNPQSPLPGQHQHGQDATAYAGAGDAQAGYDSAVPPQPEAISEDTREERRRTWWMLYAVDRHLAFCYNRPLYLRDAECQGLLQPEPDVIFLAEGCFPGESYASSPTRVRGPSVECTGHSMFGYFLPLMTVLGYIIDMTFAKDHPVCNSVFRHPREMQEQEAIISQKLDQYGASLARFEANCIAQQSHAGGLVEVDIQTKKVVAYGTHLMHTLHIALNGKWDPISLLDDNDSWISTPSFVSATGHAVAAAEAIGDILECDPDLSFMPFLFGMYLLQGSFLLLLIADKLRGAANPSVVKACETIVRAHEVCVVTLSTEYQRNFRNVMLSALAQVKGRIPEDFGVQQKRRREVLSLYRWTRDGSGLAL